MAESATSGEPTPGEGNPPAAASQPAAGGPSSETQPKPPAPAPAPSAAPQTPPASKVYTQEEVDAMLGKARSDEKTKVYSKVEDAERAAAEAKKKAEEAEQRNATLTEELDQVRSGKASEMDSITRELAELREQNKKLEGLVESVADTAAERVQKSELKAYREKQIATSGLTHFADMVAGNSEEEIDASIAKAKEREAKVMEDATAAARKELGENVPRPVAPGGGSAPAQPVVTPGNKKQIASLRGDAYQKRRQELLAEARRKAGLA